MPAESLSDGWPRPAAPSDPGTRSTPGARTTPGARIETVRLAPVGRSSSSARTFIREHLGASDSQTLDTVLLVATELVTNAVLHARTPIELTLEIADRSVLIRVFDSEAVIPEQRPHDVDRTHGRGIALVSMVSQEWGTELHDGGKTVWALISRTPKPTVR